MSKSLTTTLLLLGAGLFIFFNSMFVVTQTEQALVLQFRDIKRVVTEPGIAFKIPLIQSVEKFDKRLLDFEAPPAEFITRNRTNDVEERVVIDAFVRYRITDPVQFKLSVVNEEGLKARLANIVTSSMRRSLANYSLSDLLSNQRTTIMDEIQSLVNRQVQSGQVEGASAAPARGFGIEVVDVRIKRSDLPPDISQSTYERMRKNFTKEAQRFRAEGEEKAIEIRSGAERERTELIADAKRKAETVRGEGDGEAARIYADAFGKDPEFFRFYRSMRAYREALSKEDTTVVISPNSGFLRELNP